MWSILVETTFFKNIKIKLKNLGKKRKENLLLDQQTERLIKEK